MVEQVLPRGPATGGGSVYACGMMRSARISGATSAFDGGGGIFLFSYDSETGEWNKEALRGGQNLMLEMNANVCDHHR